MKLPSNKQIEKQLERMRKKNYKPKIKKGPDKIFFWVGFIAFFVVLVVVLYKVLL